MSLQFADFPFIATDKLGFRESHRLFVPFVIARIFRASTTGILLEERKSATNVPPGSRAAPGPADHAFRSYTTFTRFFSSTVPICLSS